MPTVPPLPQYFVDTQVPAHRLSYTEAGDGIPLLLIHGSLCDYRYWRWQLASFSQVYKVIAPSLRGFWPNAFDIDDPLFSIQGHADDLIAFIKSRTGGKPVHLLGHSRGARIAIELACTTPELVRSLILADPGFRTIGDPPVASFQFEVVEKLRSGDIDGAMTQFIDSVNGSGTWRHMVSWFKTMVKDNARTLLSQIKEVDRPFDLNRASQIRCPVLLLGAADSPGIYGRRLNSLESVIGHAKRTTIPVASHGMNLANPRAFNQQVLTFLGDGS